ncbi:hypothetical protein [Sphingomonas hengshuiensis]|uniref:Uncharacterized protein n=1 Tax=Sphingomonas hengshuiensis TaxID=1609977 RepID=A0A7U4LEH0_9SPHN|nr:hypothetical protein [Sphingomonas hengshuiensis]AJP71390.1 hypothetical protein TS85_05795 [Sphingomonas hengshuiensis]
MSILEFPRVYFGGQVSWDPITTNNNTMPTWVAAYDEANADPKLGRDPVTTKLVGDYRKAAVAQIPQQNWDPDGTHRSIFYNCCVSGVDLGKGLDTKDPFVKAPVNLAGMLVDAEPYGPYTSQLFFDALGLGINGGCRILGVPVRRSSDRYINFFANQSNNMIAGVASVLWQSCYQWEGELDAAHPTLRIDPYDSPVLQALRRQMGQPGVKGLMVRFVTYDTVYYNDPALSNSSPDVAKHAADLLAKFAAGGFQPNPARSPMVGTVGIWRDGDPMHEPGDRALLTSQTPVPVGGGAPPVPFGSGWARIDVENNRIALDLSNCVPWINRTPDKADVGEISLEAGGKTIAALSPADYAQASYEATSGIVDIPIPPASLPLLDGDLSLVAKVDGNPVTLLAEKALRAIPLEPNLYVDQDDPATAEVQVYDRGKPAGKGITVTMSEVGSLENDPLVAMTDDHGIARFPLKTSVPTVTQLVFQPGPDPMLPVTSNSFDPQVFTYMYLRVLPADDDVAALPPTWANVHDKVLSYWEALAPCMDNWLPLGDEKQVRAYAAVLRKLTATDYFERFRYMPVTRDLTRGQRTLLYNFLDSPATAPPSDGAKLKAGAPEAGDTSDFGKLARAMR